MSQIPLLYRLQQIDSDIRTKKGRLGEVLKAQKGNAELVEARARAEATGNERERWQGEQKQLNDALVDLDAKARRSEQRLYSGNVKNPKELTDLQSEIAALGRRRAGLEDQILEAMIMLEDAQAADEEATEKRDLLAAGWEETLASLQAEQTQLAQNINGLLAERAKQASRIEARLLTTYEKMAAKLGGVAVVALKANRCQGCQLTVSALKTRAAQEGEMVTCGGCGRILFPM